MRSAVLALLNAAILPLVFAGCGGKRSVPAMLDAEGKAIMIVPLSTDGSLEGRRTRVDYFAEGNRTGTQIASQASALVAAYARRARVLPSTPLAAVAGDAGLEAWLRDKTPEALREQTGADILCLGTITYAQFQDPGSVFLMHGRMQARIVVHDLVAGTVQPVEFDVQFPPAESSFRDASAFSVHEYTRQDIYEGMLEIMSRRIAQLFYPHQPDRRPGVHG